MPKQIWLLVIATTINVTGGSFLWPLNTIYMHNELGRSLAFAGFILMFNTAANIAGNLLGGALFDRYSAYKTILYGTLLATLATIGISLFHSVVPYTIFLILIGFGNGITWPVIMAMAGSVWPEGGRRAFNAIYVAQNLGVALGATLGGYIASISFDYIFWANALLFIVFFFIVLFKFKEMDQLQNPQMHTSVIKQSGKIKDKSAFYSLLILCSGFLITWVAYSQWQSTIASHTQDIGIPLEQYSSLWAINGFLIVFAQPLVKWITGKITSPRIHIYIGIAIMIVSYVIAMFAADFTMFATAMVILTMGEVLMWPAFPTLANDLAPKGRKGFYQGLVNSIGATGRMIGPVVGGFIVDMYNIELLFYILIAILFIPFVTTKLYDRTVNVEK
ncbi:MDR family MFS transporter [Oceanobacillus chungangensis]|uniref:MFS transporter n=1 Tax=Oceanobacillus chungangensis TaxID=1229152 RepID=A0A3D8PK87_9BACI|nr:MFS transporter [Oceanobacillus chungangensis]RDW15641.1 MFS transporter [Oceanobacillus chungangensis]